MMHFKIDENLPIEAADRLIKAGHDVQTVFDENLVGSDDGQVFEACQREQRAIITLDLDFAEKRRYPPEHSAGIVIIRASFQEKDHLVSLVAKIIPVLETEELKNHL